MLRFQYFISSMKKKRTWEEDHYAAPRRSNFIPLHGHRHPPLHVHGVGMEVAENKIH